MKWSADLPVPTEEQEQKVLVQWLDLRRICYTHVPNGGKRDVIVAAKLKAQGVKPGVPDILVFTKPPKAPGISGVAIELKRQRGGALSLHQAEWLEGLTQEGWIAVMCEGAMKAIELLEGLGYGA